MELSEVRTSGKIGSNNFDFSPRLADSKNTGRHMPAVSDRASCTRANRYFAWTVLVIDAGERLEKGGRGAESGIRVALEARGG